MQAAKHAAETFDFEPTPYTLRDHFQGWLTIARRHYFIDRAPGHHGWYVRLYRQERGSSGQRFWEFEAALGWVTVQLSQ